MRKTSDQPPTNREERRAIATSLVFLILGLAVVIFAKSVAGIEGDAVIVFLLLVPVLVYVIISGRLKELKGPGDGKQDSLR